MAHFAKLDENNKVLEVLVVNNEVLDPSNEEASGIAFLSNLLGHNKWKQTSYNGNFRKNYAGIHSVYDEQRDAFIPPKSFPSWVLNEDTCQWEAPVPRPEVAGKTYGWFEPNQQWIEITGPQA